MWRNIWNAILRNTVEEKQKIGVSENELAEYDEFADTLPRADEFGSICIGAAGSGI